MYKIEVHKRLHQIISVFYFMGLWQSNNRTWFHQSGVKVLHLFTYIWLPISLGVGGYVTKDKDEASFLIGLSIAASVLTIRLCYILWRKDEILDFILHFGGHSIRDCDVYNEVNDRIDDFVKYVYRFQLMILITQLSGIVLSLPVITTNKKTLPLHAYNPFVGTENEILYWVSYAFMTYLIMKTFVVTCFNGIIWYIMMCCAIKYQTLGNVLRKMGLESDEHIRCKKSQKSVYHEELIALIKSHRHLQAKTEQFKLCFSNLFFIQISTSSLGICGSVFALASINFHEIPFMFGLYIVLLVYNMFDIFMVMFFGNEIKLSSNRLSYCLFESNWFHQNESSKKALIILMENLKKPQQMIIRKLYPLDLRTFSSILNFAYSMFNILQSVK